MAFFSREECHQWQAALLVVTTQDDAVQVISAFGEVSGHLVAAALTLGFGVVVAKPFVVLGKIAMPSDVGE